MKKYRLTFETPPSEAEFFDMVRKAVFDPMFPENVRSYARDGIDLDELEETVFIVRKVLGKPSGMGYYHLVDRQRKASDPVLYYVPTGEMENLLADIIEKAKLEPYSSQKDLQGIRSPRVCRWVAKDLSAAAMRDGIALDASEIADLIACGRPKTPEERLALSAIEFVEQSLLSPESIADVLANPFAILDALDDEDAKYSPLEKIRPYTNDWELDNEQGLSYNRLFSDEEDVTVETMTKCFDASSITLGISPFPKWIGIMEWALRVFIFARLGLPLLKFVPLSKMTFDWEHGMDRAPKAEIPITKTYTESEFGINGTVWYLQMFKFLDYGLNNVVDDLAIHQERLNEAKRRLKSFQWINHRQLVLIRQWLGKDAPQPISVNDYMERFSVTINTARKDLRALVSLGFCRSATEGKREIYTPRENLVSFVESL